MKKMNLEEIINKLGQLDNYGINRELKHLKKELSVFDSCQKGLSELNAVIKKEIGIKDRVQIGGGKHYIDGFINIDVFEPADIIYDIRMNIPLPENIASIIFSEHFLEHIDFPDSVVKFFRESYRVLKLSGKLVVGVPDTGKIISAYANGDKKYLEEIKRTWYMNRSIINFITSDIDIVNLVIHDQDADEKYSPHFWGYDAGKLEYLFRTAGFTKIKKWEFDKKIANPKRQFGSIYIEGIKK